MRVRGAQAASLPVERWVAQVVESSDGCIWACSEQPVRPITESALPRAPLSTERRAIKRPSSSRRRRTVRRGAADTRVTGHVGADVRARDSTIRIHRCGRLASHDSKDFAFRSPGAFSGNRHLLCCLLVGIHLIVDHHFAEAVEHDSSRHSSRLRREPVDGDGCLQRDRHGARSYQTLERDEPLMFAGRAANGHRPRREWDTPCPYRIDLPSRPGLATSNESRRALAIRSIATSDCRTRLDLVRTSTGRIAVSGPLLGLAFPSCRYSLFRLTPWVLSRQLLELGAWFAFRRGLCARCWTERRHWALLRLFGGPRTEHRCELGGADNPARGRRSGCPKPGHDLQGIVDVRS